MPMKKSAKIKCLIFLFVFHFFSLPDQFVQKFRCIRTLSTLVVIRRRYFSDLIFFRKKCRWRHYGAKKMVKKSKESESYNKVKKRSERCSIKSTQLLMLTIHVTFFYKNIMFRNKAQHFMALK